MLVLYTFISKTQQGELRSNQAVIGQLLSNEKDNDVMTMLMKY